MRLLSGLEKSSDISCVSVCKTRCSDISAGNNKTTEDLRKAKTIVGQTEGEFIEKSIFTQPFIALVHLLALILSTR